MTSSTRFLTLLRLMAVEEWRLHSDLFGGRRFAGFPVVLLVLTGCASYALATIGVPASTLAAGLVALAFGFGLQTGSIGFVGRDSLSNLLGDVTLLLAATRTLPLSARRTVTAFILKDVGYYAVLFLLPMSLGTLGGATAAGEPALASAPAVWGMTTLAFSMGLGVTLAASSLWTGGSRLVRLAGLAAVLAVLVGGPTYYSTVRPLVTPPYSLPFVAILTFATVVLLLVGVWRFEFSESPDSRDSVTSTPRRSGFLRLQRRLGGGPLASLVAKTVIDVHRSSGGVWKLALSSGVLLGAAFVVVTFVGTYVTLPLVPAVLFGAILGATAFPTYSWLTQVDAPSDYQLYPISTRALYRAKAGAFVLLETPVVLVYYLGMAFFTDASVADLALGGGVLVGAVVFLFGVTVFVTGFQPNEFLFDTARFSAYSLLMLVGLLPLVVAGFVLPALPDVFSALTLVYAVVIGGVGIAAFDRATARTTA
ncbi:hypothetical protein [Halogranum rubrum]|uniref:ABC-2 type transport system permease protein n=1 Tax=Halogranum salarium B-1 TaxID=1210908 RepID=J2Z8Z4_9EURY|nr:hypothetical protein [Halogranum salarium]EJN57105.1 hypothetical protein HSB1_44910 [Halogranum salarium B-1]